jgi:hypothetical protein
LTPQKLVGNIASSFNFSYFLFPEPVRNISCPIQKAKEMIPTNAKNASRHTAVIISPLE